MTWYAQLEMFLAKKNDIGESDMHVYASVSNEEDDEENDDE